VEPPNPLTPGEKRHALAASCCRARVHPVLLLQLQEGDRWNNGGNWERKSDSTVRAWTRADEPRRLWNFSFLVSWTPGGGSQTREEKREAAYRAGNEMTCVYLKGKVSSGCERSLALSIMKRTAGQPARKPAEKRSRGESWRLRRAGSLLQLPVPARRTCDLPADRGGLSRELPGDSLL